jgi:hypothetical protein
LVSERSTIEIFNGTPNDGWDQVATSRLAWEGFTPTDSGASESRTFPHTLIYDYTGNAKPASLKTLEQVLNVRKEDVIGAPDPNRTVDFRIVLGASYNACTYSPWRASN